MLVDGLVDILLLVGVSDQLGHLYDPTHPDADEDGYLEMPNVDMVKEMTDAMAAAQAYASNVTAFNTLKTVTSALFRSWIKRSSAMDSFSAAMVSAAAGLQGRGRGHGPGAGEPAAPAAGPGADGERVPVRPGKVLGEPQRPIHQPGAESGHAEGPGGECRTTGR